MSFYAAQVSISARKRCFPIVIRITGALLLFLFIHACKDDVAISEEALIGKWEITEARRNGKDTHYLRGGYFIFNPEGTMTVNLTGSEERGNFVLQGQSIRFNSEREYDIFSFRQDTMGVRFPMNAGTLFEFYLARVKDETH